MCILINLVVFTVILKFIKLNGLINLFNVNCLSINNNSHNYKLKNQKLIIIQKK